MSTCFPMCVPTGGDIDNQNACSTHVFQQTLDPNSEVLWGLCTNRDCSWRNRSLVGESGGLLRTHPLSTPISHSLVQMFSLFFSPAVVKTFKLSAAAHSQSPHMMGRISQRNEGGREGGRDTRETKIQQETNLRRVKCHAGRKSHPPTPTPSPPCPVWWRYSSTDAATSLSSSLHFLLN